MNLRLDWCDYKAAEYAVLKWHYSRKMPAGKLVKIGVWEDGHFIGAILFGLGVARDSHRPFDINQLEICELVRVALDSHQANVSKIVAVAVRMLKKQSYKLRLIISYSDTGQRHVGTIYQAGNWIYLGSFKSLPKYICEDGRIIHWRTATATPSKMILLKKLLERQMIIRVDRSEKHKYAYPLDKVIPRGALPTRKRTVVRVQPARSNKGAHDDRA